jgi:hypothetical protein
MTKTFTLESKEAIEIVNRLQELEAPIKQLKVYEAEQKKLKEKLTSLMGDNLIGTCNGYEIERKAIERKECIIPALTYYKMTISKISIIKDKIKKAMAA